MKSDMRCSSSLNRSDNKQSQSEFAWSEARARFRFAGIVTMVLGFAGWVAWFYPFDDLVDRSGTPLGGDYVMLYVAGQTVAAGQAQTMYDDGLNQHRSSALFPSMDPLESWPYRYPPTVAACMSALAQLPFASSFAVFFCLQLALLLTALAMWRRNFACINSGHWLWAIAGCPLMIEVLIGGQASLLALVVVLGFSYLLLAKYDVAAGAVLALALYKPNVLVLFILGCLWVRPQLLRGFLPAVIVGVVIALATGGWSLLAEYVHLSTHLATSAWSLETPYWKVHGLAPYFQSLSPQYGKLTCFLVGGGGALAIAIAWRSHRLGPFAAMACLLVDNSLFNPYVPCYDLILLIAAFVFGCEAALRGEWPSMGPRGVQLLAAILFVGPHLSQTLCQAIGIQLFPVAVLLILWIIKRNSEAPAVYSQAVPV